MARLPLIVATFFFGATCLAADGEWKLQPLVYNHQGLQVDLGVGLWAWPMPLDYDADGDMDLLVACPDKPSNGVYLFENPGGTPDGQLPVFKAGRRLGRAGSNMQISYVDGTPRILQECDELTDFLSGDFKTRERIYPDPRFHEGSTRARMWRYADYDGDGDNDLIAGIGDWTDYGWDHAYDSRGQWRNGPLHGYVYLIENEGTDSEPDYSAEPVRLRAENSDIDVYGWPSPNLADFDGDGDLDLLCGEFLDGFTYFENVGDRKSPRYAAGRKLVGDNGQALVMDLQMITPTAFDWDQDGDFDLIVGDEDGRVAFVEHTGQTNEAGPVFRQPVYFQQEADTLKFGALATPYVYDWDGDGDEDILCGNTAGYIGLFENLGAGEGGLPRWNAPELLEVDGSAFRILAGPSGSIQGPCEAKWGYTTLSVADIDQDGDGDIVYNSILSQLGLLRNENGKLVHAAPDTGVKESPPAWYWWGGESNLSLTQWRTTPVAIDFDGDSSMDLVALDQEGFLTLRSKGAGAERCFVDEDHQPIRLNRKSCGGSGRYKLAVVDWDGDGRLDVLVNSQNAAWLRNCGLSPGGKTVLKHVGNLAHRNVAGHTSSPAVCDFNKDGKPDLLVGAENGRIYHVLHDDCVQYSEEQLTARAPTEPKPVRFPGFVHEEFVFQKAPHPQCHASTICETSRGLVAAWFGGTREKHPDVGIWASYHDGNGWQRPREWADGVQHAGHRHPCWNPVLFQPPGDAPTMLFFKVGPTPQTWWGEVMLSYDRGRSWRDRRRLPEGIDGPVRSKPILLSDGSLLCPSSTEHADDWRMHFEILSDMKHPELGRSWQRFEPETQPFQVIQPTVLTHPSGEIQTLLRSKHSKIFQAVSKDSGSSWSEMEDTGLPNPNSGIEALTLADGRHLLLYNHFGGVRKDGWGSRQVLHLAISDDGREWRKAAIVDRVDKGELSYPAMIQTSDGLVHLTYTWKRRMIKHVVIDPSRINAGDLISEGAWDSVN